MEHNGIKKDLWQMSNIITGFAVVQSISFIYACAKPDFSNMINTIHVKSFIFVYLVIISGAEIIALWWCAKKAVHLIKSQRIEGNIPNTNNDFIVKILWQAAWGRTIVVLILLIPVIASLYAKQLGGFPFNP